MKNIASILMFSTMAGTISTANAQISSVNITPDLQHNPFFKESPLQYKTIEFDKIRTEHFKPAFEYGLKIHEMEIEAVANSKKVPTFENTILPLELSGKILKRAQTAFYNLTGTMLTPELQKVQKEFAPIFSAHNDKIYLNTKLYERVRKVYEQRAKLDAESKRLVEFYLQVFELSGANLSSAKKEELKKINSELASLSIDFSTKILEARKKNGLLVNDVKELDGLTPEQIASAAKATKEEGHKGKYLLVLHNTTQQPLLQSLHNRNTREKLFKASWNRAENNDSADTRSTIEKMTLLNMKKAQLLGKKSFAEWKLQDQMAKTPEAALQLLADLGKPAIAKAKEEAKEIQALIKEQGGDFELAPWDWAYYAEQVRKAKYDLDENEIKPYFELHNVLEKGVFFAAEKFFGITTKRRTDLPVYHPDVLVYEIFDHDGKSMALFYFDFFSRDSKRGGAWMSSFVKQSKLLKQKPVIVNVLNYQKGANGKTLISYDEATTLFHEFGHGLHGLFANQQYATLSGTSVARDFVELPSQLNEFFALEPSVLKNYALHYETNEPMPQELVEKMKKALSFNQGFATTEALASATIDLAWHSITDENQLKPTAEFELEALKKHGLYMPQIPPRYHSPFFAHIWGGGYASGYYAYTWSDLLTSDGWDWITQNGGMTRANGDKFRKTILSVGNTIDYDTAYFNFTGRKPSLKPLLKDKGFTK
ncbi:MAG: M3 family metallopeptidase [Flavobacteriaceae bacterium]|nr:M3 family metallopeptidase [Flavobacteriaceae bacterium]